MWQKFIPNLQRTRINRTPLLLQRRTRPHTPKFPQLRPIPTLEIIGMLLRSNQRSLLIRPHTAIAIFPPLYQIPSNVGRAHRRLDRLLGRFLDARHPFLHRRQYVDDDSKQRNALQEPKRSWSPWPRRNPPICECAPHPARSGTILGTGCTA